MQDDTEPPSRDSGLALNTNTQSEAMEAVTPEPLETNVSPLEALNYRQKSDKPPPQEQLEPLEPAEAQSDRWACCSLAPLMHAHKNPNALASYVGRWKLPVGEAWSTSPEAVCAACCCPSLALMRARNLYDFWFNPRRDLFGCFASQLEYELSNRPPILVTDEELEEALRVPKGEERLRTDLIRRFHNKVGPTPAASSAQAVTTAPQMAHEEVIQLWKLAPSAHQPAASRLPPLARSTSSATRADRAPITVQPAGVVVAPSLAGAAPLAPIQRDANTATPTSAPQPVTSAWSASDSAEVDTEATTTTFSPAQRSGNESPTLDQADAKPEVIPTSSS
ncbi:uncharacterized protein MONBRDRAFT_11821 [Monosiga brevicollis MX1]|uniref:Uncharacterized protein n=1 Tax=Monosiga brevicollis TaxID=81824 RepID=A9VAD2_MONBE|nr:uncharacterized protein MONBRDRAFT_11821 [Monosiga brevicollis MX1]EDQ85465.1 predicted protein [Monosiga brevicollis MX1]|eukprot:XP_001749656.1 hypothetical protein [Monosiga brevicollis MX1]